jgi:hypothetical protein
MLTAMEREALRWEQEGRRSGRSTKRPDDPQAPPYAPVHPAWDGRGRVARRTGGRLRRVLRAMLDYPGE